MNAADSCFHNGGKLQERVPYIFCCINFGDSVSTLRKDGRQWEAVGGSERQREAVGGSESSERSGRQREQRAQSWVETKSRDIRPCRLGIITPVEK